MKKMYIAILDEAPDYMVPTLVAHSVINAHVLFNDHPDGDTWIDYKEWIQQSFRKVTLRVNKKEFDKIKASVVHWAGHENTICNGETSCLVCLPMDTDKVPNVLKFAKLWKPRE